MTDRELLLGCRAQHRAGAGEVLGRGAIQGEAEVGGAGLDEELAAEDDVDRDTAVFRQVQFVLEGHHEGRDVGEGDPGGLAAGHLGADPDEADRGVHGEFRDRLAHRHRACLHERGDRADEVGAGHGAEAALFQHHQAEVGGRVGRGQHQGAAQGRVAARLLEQQPAQVLEVLLAVVQPLGHRGALDVQMAADQHAAGLAFGVDVDGVDTAVRRHQAATLSSTTATPAAISRSRNSSTYCGASGSTGRRVGPALMPTRSRPVLMPQA